MRYVGIDISKWKCRAAVMCPEGTIIEEFTFPNDAEGMEKLASRLIPEDGVVMESTGSVWSTLYNSRTRDTRLCKMRSLLAVGDT